MKKVRFKNNAELFKKQISAKKDSLIINYCEQLLTTEGYYLPSKTCSQFELIDFIESRLKPHQSLIIYTDKRERDLYSVIVMLNEMNLEDCTIYMED